MKTVEIHYAGRTVALPDLPDYAKFYRKLAAGLWEPRTFEVLARNLDRETVYIDVGAWIGVTPFWASQIARSVIAVEPDPKCYDILSKLAPEHANVTILHGALSSDPEVTLHAVDGFGSSETTILDIGDVDTATAPGIAMADIMRLAGSSPAFVKIDIEGYEFAAAREIASLQNFRVRGMQLAVHPQLLERSLGGGWLSRRLRAAWGVWKLSRMLDRFLPPPALARYRNILSYIVFGVLFRRQPKGADFVFEGPVRNSCKG